MPGSDERSARQHRGGPPPGFRPASPSPGIDHRLSGPRAAARPAHARRGMAGPGRLALAPPRGLPRARRGAWLLGPCFETGPAGRRPAGFRSFERPQGVLFTVRSRYLVRYRSRGVFSLGRAAPPFALHAQAALLAAQARRPPYGACTLSGGALGPPRGGPAPAPHSAPSGRAPPASLAATGNPGWFLLRGVLICLSSARRPRRLGPRSPAGPPRGALCGAARGTRRAPRRRRRGALRSRAGASRGGRVRTASRAPPRSSSPPGPRHPPAGRSGADRAAGATCGAREGSIRRFTYGYLVTTSPSSRRGGSRPFARPGRSPPRPVGRSDGRCVQGAGTHPARGGGGRLQDIPGARGRSSPRSRPRRGLRASSRAPAGPASVARVRPRASEGITDLLSPRRPPARAGRPAAPAAGVSLVVAMEQTARATGWERPCTTARAIAKARPAVGPPRVRAW